ncbi:hypothetical protein A2960_05865 [Candidatus Gottesmanbacteria bacterium RIFCSPLOWO2_01_FULL_39_12b]|uniref:SpoVT-AbrB domain-containing protein n=1 Tax=Candidatus Gottesmanbacteria bacterium RIFCSPLOWO2_01_FULL_39_12b TaxID=1798388 RepID=A0A1F6AMY9_9BACT|nr:MAG: hypothetical protein A2960_05865 [Candidatus Gottesmanbacteria bacterium RIFCSPLOWO2_01_FULL_39_12b]
MKIGNIVSTNEKGQIVIPKDARKALGITPNSFLQLILAGNSIIINPIKDVITTLDAESSYMEILKKTAGSWANDSWPKTRKRRRRIELNAAKRAKKLW